MSVPSNKVRVVIVLTKNVVKITVAVNFIFQLIFISLLFLRMVIMLMNFKQRENKN